MLSNHTKYESHVINHQVKGLSEGIPSLWIPSKWIPSDILVPLNLNPFKIEYLQNWIPSKLNPFKIESLQNRISSKLNSFKIESLQLNAFEIESLPIRVPQERDSSLKWIFQTCRVWRDSFWWDIFWKKGYFPVAMKITSVAQTDK